MVKPVGSAIQYIFGGMGCPPPDEINSRYFCEFGNVLIVSFSKCEDKRKNELENLTQQKSRLDNHGIFYSSILEYDNRPNF